METVEDSAVYRPIPNPYITGNPVRGRGVFFGRKDDFAYVRQRLTIEQHGVVILFVGARRSGKTSIMFQILDGRLGEGYLPVFVDMQRLAGVAGDREFLERVAETVLERLDDRRLARDYYDFAAGNPVLTFDRMLADVEQVTAGRRLILLIDEAEILHAKVEAGEVSAAVLTYLASILESRRVSFCLTGSPGLSGATHAEWRRLTGKGDLREISFLSREDTLRLVREPVAEYLTYAPGVAESVYRLTHGQPFYTQVICTYAVDYLNGAQRQHLDKGDLDEVVRTIVDNPPPQLIYEWDSLSRPEQLTLSLLSEEGQDGEVGHTAEALALAVGRSGYPIALRAEAIHVLLEGLYERRWLERDDRGAYRFRVDLFRLWIRRSRSIWRLVEDTPAPARRRTVVAVALVAMALVGAAGWWWAASTPVTQRPAGRVQLADTTGGVWVNPGNVRGVRVQVGDTAATISEPTPFRGLQPGVVVLRATHPDYRPWDTSVTIVADSDVTARLDLERLVGSVLVTGAPAGSTVSWTGPHDTSFVVSSQPVLVTLVTGAYAVTIEKAEHATRNERVVVLPDQEITLSARLELQAGSLHVISNPPGATVLVDGRGTGLATPATVPDLSLGPHRVRLLLADHDPVEVSETVRQGVVETVTVGLPVSAATLRVLSQPSASIYLIEDGRPVGEDGRPVGDTPKELTLSPGEYVVRLVRLGFETQWRPVHLRPGESLPLDFGELREVTGVVKISSPLYRTVIVDEQDPRRTQPAFRLREGPHTLRLEDSPHDTTIHVARDETTRVALPEAETPHPRGGRP
jgi:hypothetical protein